MALNWNKSKMRIKLRNITSAIYQIRSSNSFNYKISQTFQLLINLTEIIKFFKNILHFIIWSKDIDILCH